MSDPTAVPWNSGGPPPGVLQRIVEILIDQELDFWDEDLLRVWYDNAAAEQHRIVLENALRTGRIRSFNDDYLRYFLASGVGALVAGTRDYTLPTDCLHVLEVEITQTGAPDIQCRRADIGDDWKITNLPNWRPHASRPKWALTEDGKLRFYLASPDTIPDVAFNYRVLYYRDVVRTAVAEGSNVDLLDPWNDGPVNGAVGVAFEKQRRDPTHWLGKAMRAAYVIMPPPPEPRR